MDLLEELVRDTLAEHAEHAPTVSALLSRDRRHGRRAAARWTAAGLAAAAVAAIAVGATVIAHHSTATTPVIDNTGSPEPIPAGQKAISYHGIEILVPAALPITNVQCGPPARSEIITDEGIALFCGAINGETPRGLTTVSLSPLVSNPSTRPPAPSDPRQLARTRTTVDGRPALIGFGAEAASPGDVVGVLQLDDPGVFIEVTTPTKAATEAILQTVRVITVDRLGCRSHIASLTPTGNPPAAELVPGSPVSAVVCQYETGYYPDPYNLWLLQSSTLSPSTTRRVASVINGLPPHKASGSSPFGIHDLITFTYANGSARTIDALVYTDGTDRVVTDGNRSVYDVKGALQSLLFE